jgi:hypothetical protein
MGFAAVVLDVLDVCENVPQSVELMSTQKPRIQSVELMSTQKPTSTACVVGGDGGSDGGAGRRVENRRAKLTDVWQPRKNS